MPTKDLVAGLYNALKSEKSKAQIAASFIYTLALVIIKMAKSTDYKIVACSGGVFQNGLLVKSLLNLAEEHQLELKLNHLLSCNDENISFGQLCCHRYLKD